jgi:hypothetical protein
VISTGGSYGVAVAGNYLYVCNEQRLQMSGLRVRA